MNKIFLTTLVVSFLALTPNTNAQYKEISGSALESTIFSNHQNGLPGHHGLYNNLSFKVEDYSILNSNFDKMNQSLNEKFKVEKLELASESQQFFVIYDKTLAKTDDFLKILKEVLSQYNVYLVGYEESTLVKSEE